MLTKKTLDWHPFLAGPILACMLIFLAGIVHAEELARMSTGQVALTLESSTSPTRDLYTMVFSTKGDKAIEPEVFGLKQPSRLVVDLPGFQVKAAEKINLRHSTLRAVRVGRHKNKIRYVVDLNGVGKPGYRVEWSADKRTATVHFGFDTKRTTTTIIDNAFRQVPKDRLGGRVPQAPEMILAPVPIDPPQDAKVEKENKPIIAAKPVEEVKPEPVAVPEKPAVVEKKSEPEVVQPVKPMPIKAPIAVSGGDKRDMEKPPQLASVGKQPILANKPIVSGGAGELRGYRFNPGGTTDKVAFMIDMSDLGEYSLKRKQPDLYELVLQKTRLAKSNLELPFFPPDSYHGLEVVKALSRGSDVVVRIYVEDGVRLTPVVRRGKLWVQVLR